MQRSSSCFRVFVAVFLTAMLACTRSSVVLQQKITLTNNLVVVPVRVNGSRQLPFILDTGASASVIDRRQAESLRLAATAAANVSTGGGDVEASEINGVALQIGDVGLPDLNVIAIDSATPRASLAPPSESSVARC